MVKPVSALTPPCIRTCRLNGPVTSTPPVMAQVAIVLPPLTAAVPHTAAPAEKVTLVGPKKFTPVTVKVPAAPARSEERRVGKERGQEVKVKQPVALIEGAAA